VKIGKIEKNVPVPEVHSKITFPWSKMNVGDSVLVSVGKGEDVNALKCKVKGSARYYGVRTNKKFRSLLSRAENGVRVWRVE